MKLATRHTIKNTIFETWRFYL